MAQLEPVVQEFTATIKPVLDTADLVGHIDAMIRRLTSMRDDLIALSQPPDGSEVHVDWRMTRDEWADLRGVLLQHTDVEFVRRLAEAGKLGESSLHPAVGQVVHYWTAQDGNCLVVTIAIVADSDQPDEARAYVAIRDDPGVVGSIRHGQPGDPGASFACWHYPHECRR